MSRRYKSPTMKFGLPLAAPHSKRVFHCYASHGKGYGFASGPPTDNCPVLILAVNVAREACWEDGMYVERHRWSCPALAGDDEWRMLGWMTNDESLPFGDLDAVDPDLAQFDYLTFCNSPPPSTFGFISPGQQQ